MDFLQNFVAFTMATLNIDGKADKTEYDVLTSSAAELNLDKQLVQLAIQKELSDPTMVDDLNIDELSYEERVSIFKACVKVVLADGELAMKEISAINTASRLLCLQEELCTMYLISCVKNNSNLKIKSTL